MGIGGISIWQLLIIALIIVLLFGTKKLRSVGTDLGGALKGFKKAVKDDEEEEKEKEKSDQEQIAEMDSDDDSAAEAAAKAKADAAAAEADRKKQSTASTRNEHSDKS